MKILQHKPRFGLLRVLICGVLISVWSGVGAAVTIPDRPLFLGNDVQPNIFLALDDSGSMADEVALSDAARALPGALTSHWYFQYDRLDDAFAPSSAAEDRSHCVGYNVLAYNPNVTYTPWVGTDTNGNPWANQSITAAQKNPAVPANGSKNLLNIGGKAAGYGTWVDGYGANPADGVYQAGECPVSGAVDGTTYANRTYDARWVYVNTLSAAQQRNYANWYAYYRRIGYVVKRAVGEIINISDARMGLATLNNSVSGIPVADLQVAANKQALLNRLRDMKYGGDTPLRSMLARVGQYFDKTDGSDSLHAGLGFSDPSPILSATDGGECGQNFALLFSDGYWNGTYAGVGNTDIGGPGPWDGGPHADAYDDTLADIAMHYYERDLAPGLANNLAVIPGIDDNTTQHLVTYTVAFGVNGTLTASPANHADTTPAPPWPQPLSGQTTTVDDMRHAAFNARGGFFSAKDPQSLINGLTNAFAKISDRTGSASAASASGQTIKTGSLLFVPEFDTQNWHGDVAAYELLDDGVIGTERWRAANKIPAETAREIFTWSNSAGAIFEWGNLTAAQQTAIGSQQVLDYIRGDRSQERVNGGNFRDRTSLLGDIIHSSPVAVTKLQSSTFYSVLPGTEGSSFLSFLAAKQSRPDMVYVGANDGLLHALQASDGVEAFAYAPSSLFAGLAAYAKPDYGHKYYVDGLLTVADAYLSGAWKSVLLGTLGRGSKGLFALDVTSPGSFDAGDVMWEFTHAELGNVLGEPQIVRTNSGHWVAIVGNGYNSSSDRAGLIIVDLATGTLLAHIETSAGSAANSNGLATPLLVDSDQDFSVDYAYGGDLHGNLWKFDLSAPDPANWGVALSGTPLYAARDPNNNPQPITSKPSIAVHPDGGYVLLFGTGRYFASGDDLRSTPEQVHTFYGIRDQGAVVNSVGTRVLPSAGAQPSGTLQPQLIEAEVTQQFDGVDKTARVLSDNAVDYTSQHGWYIDLVSPVAGAEGERVVSKAQVRLSHDNTPLVIFNTFVPAGGCDEMGGYSFTMAFHAISGGQTLFHVFDLNNDGNFDASDGASSSNVNEIVSGFRTEVSLGPVTLVDNEDGSKNFVGSVNLDGGGGKPANPTGVQGPPIDIGRQSWRQLR